MIFPFLKNAYFNDLGLKKRAHQALLKGDKKQWRLAPYQHQEQSSNQFLASSVPHEFVEFPC